MLTTLKRNRVILAAVILANAACSIPQERWKSEMDYYVAHRYHLEEHMRKYKVGSVIEEIREVSPGVLEYYIERGKGIVKPGEECKIVFVVEKATDEIIGWRYNGNPDYCWIAS